MDTYKLNTSMGGRLQRTCYQSSETWSKKPGSPMKI